MTTATLTPAAHAPISELAVTAALYVAAVPTAVLADMPADRGRRVAVEQGAPLLADPTFGQTSVVYTGLAAAVPPHWVDRHRATVCRRLAREVTE